MFIIKTRRHSHPISRLAIFTLCLNYFLTFTEAAWWKEKKKHEPGDLDKNTFKQLALAGEEVDFEEILDPLLTTRVSGTTNNKRAKDYIVSFMHEIGWKVETDKFDDDTPHGTKQFTNIIATLNPKVERRLVLACHYDSRYTKENNFIGATDSAVPCAMLLHLAKVLEKQLTKHKKNQFKKVTLQFIFFDGEEAFESWSATDSLYGSRHLAAKWEETEYPKFNDDKTTMLSRIDLMILLDLLGTKDCKLVSYFESTYYWYKIFAQAESRLKLSGLWRGPKDETIFKDESTNRKVEDDHVPFLERGVDIVHLIPPRFPKVWHRPADNKEALDFTTIDDMNKVFRIFVARYLRI